MLSLFLSAQVTKQQASKITILKLSYRFFYVFQKIHGEHMKLCGAIIYLNLKIENTKQIKTVSHVTFHGNKIYLF